MTDTPLKPCPFCGGERAMMFEPTCRPETPYNPADRLYPIVRCMSCYAEVTGKNEDYFGKTAIAAWNRRPAQTYTQDQLDAAVRAARNETLDELRTISETYCYAPGIKMTTSIAATLARLTAKNERLLQEVEHYNKSGIVEIAVRNPSVADYMAHWEGRAEKAEAENERLRERVDHALMTFAETSNLTIEERAQRMADTLAEALEQP